MNTLLFGKTEPIFLNKQKVGLYAFFIFLLNINLCFSQSQTCQFIAEISIVSVEKGAFLACTKSGNPAACTIALAAHNCGQDPACDGLIKKFVEDGCNYTVEVVGNKIKIIGTASKEKIFEMQKTYEALNTVEGIYWLQKVLGG